MESFYNRKFDWCLQNSRCWGGWVQSRSNIPDSHIIIYPKRFLYISKNESGWTYWLEDGVTGKGLWSNWWYWLMASDVQEGGLSGEEMINRFPFLEPLVTANDGTFRKLDLVKYGHYYTHA